MKKYVSSKRMEIKTISLVFIILFFSIVPFIASAQLVPCGSVGNPCKICHLFEMVGRIWNLITIVAGSLATIMVMIGGITYLMSFGDQKNLTKAKNIFLSALIGLIFIFLSRSIVMIIYSAMGANGVEWWNICP